VREFSFYLAHFQLRAVGELQGDALFARLTQNLKKDDCISGQTVHRAHEVAVGWQVTNVLAVMVAFEVPVVIFPATVPSKEPEQDECHQHNQWQLVFLVGGCDRPGFGSEGGSFLSKPW